ncbi:branched-chain amino acid ABC transporter permease [Brevibacillus sp. SYP-B805]|uniref:branched-chain amino acid ABC transporter permease n=1 Tax=Brevibacillus sp. SYP-B805 TaxID=1578199 RepID=UPI0013EC455F|nr:branched-chain amino acid ABC transporter permease [Brevibacillus sp. SYP-B805]NGQ96128.1 branched-chain amino acid ABC transporter permease [Brevibacillus sp. SYP-B805]
MLEQTKSKFSIRFRSKTWLGLLLLLPILFGAPFLLGSYLTSVFVIMGIYCITTVGITLLMGYAGLVSLAGATFWGIGAYVTGIGALHLGIDPLLGIPFAIIIAGAVAFGLGWITRNLQGHYFSLATLGFGIVINIILIEESEYTGGSSGLIGIPGLQLGSMSISGDAAWFVFVWILAMISLVLCNNLVNSAWGRNLRSMHASQAASEAMGIDTGRYRLQAFVISGMFAGLGGGLYACYMSFISPAVFNFDMSIKFVLMAVLGGLGSIWGAMVGVMVVTLLVELLREYVPLLMGPSSSGGPIEVIFFGLLMVIMMIYMPEGIIGMYQKVKARWRGKTA